MRAAGERSNGRRRRQPETTVMHDAFLRALLRWAERGDHTGTVAIPTGRVNAAELARVVINLKCAGRIQARAS
jgi:hypothetical protein